MRCRVEPDCRPAVRSLDPAAAGDLVHDRLRDLVAGAQGVRELRAVGVQEDGAVGTRGSGME